MLVGFYHGDAENSATSPFIFEKVWPLQLQMKDALRSILDLEAVG
jgi:hypothetical protein